MSWLSEAEKYLAGWINGPSTSQATKDALQPVVAGVQTTANAAKAALVPLAVDAVDAGLALIPGNTPFVGLEAEFLQAMAAEIAVRLAPKQQ